MTNSLDTLGSVLAEKLQERLNNAKPGLEHMIQKLETAAVLVGTAYDIGKFFPPSIDVEASKARLKPGDKPTRAIAHYVGHANGTITKLMGGAFVRIRRKDNATGVNVLAMYVVEDLLRAAVRAKAGVARLEAAANTGPFAAGEPDYKTFETLADKVPESLIALCNQLEGASTGEEVVRAFAPSVQKRITGNVQPAYQAIERAVERSANQHADHAKRVAESSAEARKGLGVVVGTVKGAAADDLDAIGEALRGLYVLQRRFPYYFGLYPRKRENPKKKSANNSAASESTPVTEAPAEDAAA